MAYDFSKGSKTIRKVGFLDGVSGSKIRPVSPFPLESSKGLVAKYFDSTKESLSATRLLDQSPLNSGTRRTGEEGRCYLYDGVNDYSTLDAGFTASGDFTLSFNINATSFASPFHVFIASTTSDRIYFNNGISFNIIANGTLSIFTLDKTLVAGAWYNILVRRVSGTITVYVDGVAQSDTEANAQDLDFLYLSSSTIGLNANIFDVRYFNSAITDPQLNYVVSFGRTGTPVTPTNWWKCDEQSGTVGYDSVGGNHLTHNNITEATFHATQDIWSFQNQVGYSEGVNYIYHSEDFLNVVWAFANDGITRLANQTTAPDGSLTADLITETNTTREHRIWYYKNNANAPFIVGEEYTYTIHLKSNGRDTIYIESYLVFASYIDLNAETATRSGATITNVGNGWYRISIPYIATSTQINSINHRLTNPAQTLVYTGDGVSGMYFWGAQIQKGNFTVYQKTDSSTTIGVYIPRDESDPTNDVLGNPLTNTGRRPNDAALHSSNCLTADGTLYIAAAHLTGSETVVSSGGTSTPSISAGRIDFTAGTCWDLTLSDGTHYPLSEGGGIGIHDDSGSGNHGILTNAVLANAWGGVQDSYHKNLSDGFVYAYQPAKQVFTAAQAANITGISFKFRSDGNTSNLVIFGIGNSTQYLMVLQQSSPSNLTSTSSGTPTILIDGSAGWGTTRGDLYTALCDGNIHEVYIADVAFSGDWLANGIYINSYTSGGYSWDSTTYLWDLQATDSNGDPIYPADPDVRLPAVTSSLGPYSIPLTDLPSDPYHNRAETLIDLDPDSTPEMNNIYLESVFNGSTSNGYVTNDSVLNFTDNLTVSCWAKSDLTDITSSADTLVSMYESTGNLQVWRMEISTDEKLRFQVGNSGGNGTTIETADSSYPIDTWTHYAATFDGGVVKLYVNGELQSSSESSAHATSLNGRSAPLVLGAYYWSGGGGSFQEWGGALRNIRVYKGDSSPLSNSQIVRDMIETRSQPRFEGQTVIASYDLVKDTLDRSGNSLNAQNNNISFTKKTVPASLDLGADLGEDGIVQKTVKFDSGEWGAVFDGSSYAIVKNREKLKIKEKPFSIECSVKTTDTGSNTILSKYQTSGNLRSYSLNIESGKIVFHSSSNGTAVVSSTGSDTINDGSWHKIKVVRESESGTSLKMYVDDVEDTGVGGSLASNFSENISNVAIGAYNTDATAANVFTGNIRELKVFTDDNIERASWELAKDTRDSSSNNYHGENNGITFLTPKQEYGYTVSDSTPLAKQDQYLKEYHKSRLFL